MEKLCKALAVVGPTASGKTALSLPLARRLQGEILCADSMQVYRGMDIGTAKATPAEREAVPHHLLDLADPLEAYSAADYAADAQRVLEEVCGRGKTPIFVGGTGLYLEAARSGRHDASSGGDPVLRERLAAQAREEGNEALWQELRRVDPESADAIHPNNLRRVIRALEIYRKTGVCKSEWDRRSRQILPRFSLMALYLTFEDRELLYRRIGLRVEEMFRLGLCDEVRSLLERGVLNASCTAAQAIGYKEVIAHVRGEMTKEQAIEAVTLATRHYAKRQITWFSAQPYTVPITVDRGGAMRPSEELVREAWEKAETFLAE